VAPDEDGEPEPEPLRVLDFLAFGVAAGLLLAEACFLWAFEAFPFAPVAPVAWVPAEVRRDLPALEGLAAIGPVLTLLLLPHAAIASAIAANPIAPGAVRT
jgi:hypothetical protein